MHKSYLVHLSAGAAYFTQGMIESESWDHKYQKLTDLFDCGQDSVVISACECVPALMAAFDYLVTDLDQRPEEVPAYEFWERLGAEYCALLSVEDYAVSYPSISQVENLLKERLRAVFCPDAMTPDVIDQAVEKFRAAW